MPCNDCSRTETCPPCVNEDVCVCGHTKDQHQGPEGLGGEQCTACSGCSERSWRHPFTPPETPAEPETFSCEECGEPIKFFVRTMESTPRWEHVGHSGHAAVPPQLSDLEPPLTPEEEEAAPEDPAATKETLCVHCGSDSHIWANCQDYEELTKAALPLRRPPYAVAYAVSGRLFEALVPGDCAVEAVDGALVIKHSEPVLGIRTVAPVRKAS